jgi:N-acetylglutamate synthase-like GNAT family acetyltransferase
MNIIDLGKEHIETYCKCLEDWSTEFDDEENHKRTWYEEHKNIGLRVKLAQNDNNQIVGMIQYIPVESAPINGKDLYYIYCIWVHGHKEGVGNNQHKGIGKMLLDAAENDAKNLGAKGIVAWGIKLPFFMRSSWFKKHGYKKVDSDGISELVLKSFTSDVSIPSFIKPKQKIEKGTDCVKITCFMNGWCPAQNIVYERAKKVAKEYENRIDFIGIDTNDRETLLEYGIVDGLFVDDKQIRTGPPPSYEKIKTIIEKQIRKRNREPKKIG